MRVRFTTDADMRPAVDTIMAVGSGAPPLAEKVQMAGVLRDHLGTDQQVYEILIRELTEARGGLVKAQEALAELRALVEKLTASPWHPAVFLRFVTTSGGTRAVVSHGTADRVVSVSDEVDSASLHAGDEVYLSSQLNFIHEKAPYGPPRCGQTCFFDRRLEDGRIVARWRDEEIILEDGAGLAKAELERGDALRLKRNAWLALETMDRSQGREYLVSEVPDIGRDRVGGQAHNLDRVLSFLTAVLTDPEAARDYGLSFRTSMLMVGPPGCGKTLMAKVAASEISRRSGKPCHFFVVKPGQWESPWVGETQANIRNTFQAAREASRDGFAVLFLDEIDSIGLIRGRMANHHADRALGALLSELDGFADRGNVAVIAATNRKDSCDPALLERISETEVHVPRPDMDGAQEVFGIHLPSTVPLRPNGSPAETARTRRRIIETAVSRFYSPNAQNELCQIRFRDGNVRTVTARELASGRTFEQVCHVACKTAFTRQLERGQRGVGLEDMEAALCEVFERLRTTLTPMNAHTYLADLPQDVDVVSVEPIRPRVAQRHAYIELEMD